jgi:hypothetical protein
MSDDDLAKTARVALGALEHMEWQAAQLFSADTQARIGVHLAALRTEFARWQPTEQRANSGVFCTENVYWPDLRTDDRPARHRSTSCLVLPFPTKGDT